MDDDKKINSKKKSYSKKSNVSNDTKTVRSNDRKSSVKSSTKKRVVKKEETSYKKDARFLDNNQTEKENITSIGLEENNNDNILHDDVSNDNHSNNSKTKKTVFTTSEVIIIMLITIMFGLLIGGFVVFNKYEKNNSKECLQCSKGELSEFVKVYNDIINNYYDEVDKKTLIDSAISGMVKELNDPYSVYLDSNANADFNQDLNGYFTGIGVEIFQPEGDYPTVLSVFDNSPAKDSGIMPGDKIVKVRGKDVTGMIMDAIVSLIKDGEVGDVFDIAVNRDGKEISLETTLAKVDMPSVYVSYIEKDNKKIAVVTITKFALNTYSQFKEVYNQIKENNAYGMIIDVRGNSGGYLASAYNIASMFVDKDVVVYEEDTKGEIEKILSQSNKEIDIPVVMLVNEGSASASEVLTISLKENIGAKVVGSKTFGKGSIQIMRDLSNGSSVKYTIQKWLSPNGNSVDGVGITPDVVVSLSQDYFENPSVDKDNQLQAAISELLK